ncbi:hypothetical protein EPUS_02141 [Endocarpon pusillum Z07020]|uniref:Large ribosomal subunit protein mL53 n=1 Tax=Endocarpon pusillum (strain Z07020 / HMAS-L-300199) TaxID=1263415 RepID=U1HSR4_ENDPU|nr:uncharacterized protein EPUS_02141 [Endocarpon pusillum Z07020]ERF72254.1 hypothetical protein EPUS_02141 [Endocarpon pusillum Z07020]
MKTTYLTSLSTTLSPFSPHGKVPRLVLTLLPADARSRIAIKTTLLPRSSALTSPATLELGFKDGKKMQWRWEPKRRLKEHEEGQRQEAAKLKDVVEEVERHWRGLNRKEELAG